jgi:hypothetical protein
LIVVMPLRPPLPDETTKVLIRVIAGPIIGTIRPVVPKARLPRISNEASMTV